MNSDPLPSAAQVDRPGAATKAGWRVALGSPQDFYPIVAPLLPWLFWVALAACSLGVFLGLLSPQADAPHAGAYRIVFIHAPAVWTGRGIYLLMAAWAGVALLSRHPLPSMMVRALAPTGAIFALMALWTGSLWIKSTWGNWWDPRLAAELTLALLCLAILALHAATEDSAASNWIVAISGLAAAAALGDSLARPASWSHLHLIFLQHAFGGMPIPEFTRAGIVAMGAGFWAYATGTALRRLRCLILERERDTDWVLRVTGSGP